MREGRRCHHDRAVGIHRVDGIVIFLAINDMRFHGFGRGRMRGLWSRITGDCRVCLFSDRLRGFLGPFFTRSRCGSLFRRCKLGRGLFELGMKIDAESTQVFVFEPTDLSAGNGIEILDEDDLRVFFQHHEFVRVGELALGFVRAGRVRVARALLLLPPPCGLLDVPKTLPKA